MIFKHSKLYLVISLQYNCCKVRGFCGCLQKFSPWIYLGSVVSCGGNSEQSVKVFPAKIFFPLICESFFCKSFLRFPVKIFFPLICESFFPQNFPAIRYILSSVYKSFDEHIHRHTRWRMFQQWQFCVEIKGCSFACFHRVIVFKAPAYRWTSLKAHMGFTLRSYQARMSPALNRNSAVRSSNMTMQSKYHNLQFLHGTAIYVSEKRLAWRG